MNPQLAEIIEKLENLEKLIQRQPLQNAWFPLNMASQYSGLSRSTLARAIQAGKLKCSKQTGKILIRRIWLDKFIMFGKQRITPTEKMELGQI